MKIILPCLVSLRPKHWLKNLLVFTALIFAFQFDTESFASTVIAFFALSFVASSIYIINDIFDASRDKLHPKKRYRPIPAGRVKIWQALLLFFLIMLSGMFLASLLPEKVILVCVLYLVLNFSYSFGLKHLSIVDVMIIASGFVLRIIVGAYAISVPVSHWLLLCAFFISLFVAFGKRKNEMDILDQYSRSHRRSISEYTEGFMSQMLAITAGISIVFYALYTIDPTTIQRFGSDNLIYTTPIVVFAVLRYFHLLYNKKDGGDPVAIFTKDIPMIAAVLFWLTSIIMIYFFDF